MYGKIKFALTLFLLVTFTGLQNPSFSFSAAEKDEFKSGFFIGFTNPQNIEKKLDLVGLRGDGRAVAKDYMMQLGKNEKFIDYMVEGLIDAPFMRDFREGRINKAALAQHVMRFSYEIEANLSMKGLLRLSDEDLKTFISILADTFLVIESKYCRSLAGFAPSSQLDEISSAFAMLQTMDAGTLRSYYRVTLNAMNAELNDFPAVPIMNDYQVEQANLAYENAILDRYIKSGSPAYLNALGDPDSAADYDICRSMAFTLEVAHDLDGATGEWMRSAFFR